LEIKVLKNVMIKNDLKADDNRATFLKNKVLSLNLVSSPGAGKTTLLENTLALLHGKYRTTVIEGDLYTSRDAERLKDYNIPIVQINTEGGCHLDARMVGGALKEFALENTDVVFIENVGNLVCPASFDLGEEARVLVYAITEGEDKPKKYETMFRTADVVLINKIDLASACNVDIEKVADEIKSINNKCMIIKISALNKSSLKEWLSWLEGKLERVKKG
jgi:hydrogenase nickel incorporation protein HypB